VPPSEPIAPSARLEQRTYPPYDAFHGTNWPMLWRRVIIETTAGAATLEQTDYGHPGRLNPWTTRGIPPSMAPRIEQLIAVAEALAALTG
jgi:hypothetical protein